MRLVPSSLLVALLASAAGAQVQVTLLDTVPPGQRLFRGGQATLEVSVSGTTNGVQLDLFTDAGAGPISVLIPDPSQPPPTRQLTVPLPTNVDRQPVSITAVARDEVTNEIALAGPFVVQADDVGPDPVTITAPANPVTLLGPTLRIEGRVTNQAPGGATQPEDGGRIEVRRGGQVIGGGAVLADASFLAIAQVTGVPPGGLVDLEVLAIDPAGNPGAPTTQQVRCPGAGAVTVTASLDPPDGTITRNPGVAIQGTAEGADVVDLHVFVNGRLSSQLRGLPQGDGFRHTLTLPGEGDHALSVQATPAGGAPDPAAAVQLGVVSLDR